MKSIIQTTKECFICREFYGIEGAPDDPHHCIHGGSRRRADSDGLYVYLCRFHHDRLHDHGEFDKELQIIAQRKFLETHTRKEWFERYGKFYD